MNLLKRVRRTGTRLIAPAAFVVMTAANSAMAGGFSDKQVRDLLDCKPSDNVITRVWDASKQKLSQNGITASISHGTAKFYPDNGTYVMNNNVGKPETVQGRGTGFGDNDDRHSGKLFEGDSVRFDVKAKFGGILTVDFKDAVPGDFVRAIHNRGQILDLYNVRDHVGSVSTPIERQGTFKMTTASVMPIKVFFQNCQERELEKGEAQSTVNNKSRGDISNRSVEGPTTSLN